MNNKELIEKYPWLQIRNVWTRELVEPENYEFTWLDDLPDGWRKAFGLKMAKELDKILRKANYQNQYQITQIKEKYGVLCWYDNGVPAGASKEYDKWLAKYEELSKHTCLVCGKPGEIDYTQYWLIPLCDRHRKEEL